MSQYVKRIAGEGPRTTVLAAAILLVWLALAIASCTVYLVADDWGCLERVMDHGLAWSFNMAVPGRLFYRPLTQDVYYRFMSAVFGIRSVPYHVVNMLLQAAVIMLVIRLGRKLTGRREAGLWAGLLFAANPASFLTINFVSGIQEIAMMLLSLSAVLCFISQGREDGGPDPRRRLFATLGPTAYIISLFAKESVLLAPVWLWIYDLARGLAAKQRLKDIIRSRLKLHLPFDLAMLLYLGLRLTLMPPPEQGAYQLTFFSARLFTSLEEFMRVAANSLGLPAFTGLDSYYAYLALAVVIGMGLAVWAGRARKLPMPVFLGLAWFGVNLAIFLPLTGRFYPYYISYALIGLFVAAGHGLDVSFAYLDKRSAPSKGGADTPVGPSLGDKSVPATARAFFIIILVILLGSSAWNYSREYRDNFIVNLARATRVIHEGIKAAHPTFPPGARIIFFSDYRVHDPSHFGLRALYHQPDLKVYLEAQAYTIAWQDNAYVFIPRPGFNYLGVYGFAYTKGGGFMEIRIAPDGSVPFTGKAPGG
ncbi:MAG TPA: hypothetical protein VM658_00455 [bacterium]|nr:hypothetical protein [bacterium]